MRTNTPISDSTLGSSNKENLPPLTNETTPSDDYYLIPTNAADDADEVLPDELTYEAFVRYCQSDERRADLYEELKDQGCSSWITDILNVFYQTFQMEAIATNARYANSVTDRRLSRLREDVREFNALTHSHRHPTTTAILSGFAGYIDATRAIVGDNDKRLIYTANNYHHVRRGLFEVLLNLSIVHNGNRSFSTHKFMQKFRVDVVDESRHWDINWDGREKTNGWVTSGKEEKTPPPGWEPVSKEELDRWEPNFKQWGTVDPSRLHTDFIDPQA